MALKIGQITDEKDLKGLYRLRFKVYCMECKYENPDKYEDGIVSDLYDENAVNLAVKDDAQKIVGGVRLILDSEAGFPTENFCEIDKKTPRTSIAEISRLVIHRDYRRRSEDKYIYGPDEERRSIGSFDYEYSYSQRAYSRRSDDRYKQNSRRVNGVVQDRRARHDIVSSLFKELYQESKRRNITHWYSLMTQGIFNLLARYGLGFESMGEPVDYYGIRTPYLGDIKKIEQIMEEKNPAMLEEYRRGL
ncbi:GNAT family N-acetyltransferase [bacterium]|nr:GNAT family N-acetyltransferase [bacterium]